MPDLSSAITAPLYDMTITATYPSNIKVVMDFSLCSFVSMLRDPMHLQLLSSSNPSVSRDK